METADTNFWIMIGGVIASLLVGFLGVARGRQEIRKTSADPIDPGIRAIGMELGNRQQMQDLVDATNRIGDILENKKQSETDAKLNELLRRSELHE